MEVLGIIVALLLLTTAVGLYVTVFTVAIELWHSRWEWLILTIALLAATLYCDYFIFTSYVDISLKG